MPPGSPVHIGEKRSERVKITVIDYDDKKHTEKVVGKVEDCFPFKDKPTVTWINVDGIHDINVIEGVGAHFGLHPLLIEDLVNTDQRPKMEDFDEYLFIVLKMLTCCDKGNLISAEQVSLVLGPNFVISFQEKEGDVFDPVRSRIREGKGKSRKGGADYIAYSLIDAVVDNYFGIIEDLGEKIESLEEKIVADPSPNTLRKIHALKGEMIFLRRSVYPLREVVSSLERTESQLVRKSTKIYLRDVYDHTIQVIDMIETFRDMMSSMIDIYMSSISNRMNEVMKVLTVIATVFIPLTYITGWYGMNFRYMPELEHPWGYPAVILIMVALAAVMFLYFKRKKWI